MNSFELLGRINWLDIRYSDSGTCFTKIMLAKKKPKTDNEYESFLITFLTQKTIIPLKDLLKRVKKVIISVLKVS